MILAPDDRLPQGPARWTREALAEAWSSCRRDLKAALLDPEVATVAVLVGTPAAGKSSWSRDHDQDGLVIFDACWADRPRRVALAHQIRVAGKIAIAVWVQTPLDVCRERNEARPRETRVPDVALARAWVALRHEPPTVAEGWSRVLIQDGQAERIHDAAVPPERQLERAASAPATTAWKVLKAKILPALAKLEPGVPFPAELEKHFLDLEKLLAKGSKKTAADIAKIGALMEKRERAAWDKVVSKAIGTTWETPPNDALVAGWSERQATKVSEIAAGIVPGLRESIEEARAKGWTAAQIEKAWSENGLPLAGFGTAEGRARVLAKGSAAEIASDATRAAQEALDCDQYEWGPTTSKTPDPEHATRRGKRFRWSEPPPDGHPGMRPGCHCTAKPVITLAEAKDLKAALGLDEPKPVAKPAPAPAPAPPPPKPKAPAKPAPSPAPVAPTGSLLGTFKPEQIAIETSANARKKFEQLGKGLGEEERTQLLASLISAHPSDVVGVVRVEASDYSDTIYVTAKLRGDKGNTAVRTLTKDPDSGEWILKNNLLVIDKDYPPGYGTKALRRQMEAAAKLGIGRVKTDAAGGKNSGEPDMNGYYTWPRLGYDGPVPIKYPKGGKPLVVPPELLGDIPREKLLVSDLMATPEGRAWWKKNGTTFEASFDPRPGSRSMKILDAYMAEKSLAAPKAAPTASPPKAAPEPKPPAKPAPPKPAPAPKKPATPKAKPGEWKPLPVPDLPKPAKPAPKAPPKPKPAPAAAKPAPVAPAPKPTKGPDVPDPASWTTARKLEAEALAELTPAKRKKLLQLIEQDQPVHDPQGPKVGTAGSSAAAKAWGKTLTKKQREAIVDWSESGYSRMRAVDGGIGRPSDLQMSGERYLKTREQLVALREAMRAAPKHEGEIYRGLTIPLNVASAKAYYDMITTKGNEFKLESLSSWSHNKAVSKNQFSSDVPGGLLVRITKSTRGVPINAEGLSSFGDDEGEILIDRGSRYRVVSVSRDPDDQHRLLVDLEEI